MIKPRRVVREKRIEDYFVGKIRKAFPTAEIRKFEIQRGDPDRIVFLPNGVTVLVELKRPGEEPREEQYRALERFKALGFEATWLSTREQVDTFIEKLKHGNS